MENRLVIASVLMALPIGVLASASAAAFPGLPGPPPMPSFPGGGFPGGGFPGGGPPSGFPSGGFPGGSMPQRGPHGMPQGFPQGAPNMSGSNLPKGGPAGKVGLPANAKGGAPSNLPAGRDGPSGAPSDIARNGPDGDFSQSGGPEGLRESRSAEGVSILRNGRIRRHRWTGGPQRS